MKGEEEDRGAAGKEFLTVEVGGVTSEVIRSHCPVSLIFILFSCQHILKSTTQCFQNCLLILVSADPEKSELPLSDELDEEKSVSILQLEVFQNIDELGLDQMYVGFIPNKEWFLLSK